MIADTKPTLDTVNKKYRRLLKSALSPRPKISGSEWARQNCYLPSEYSATPGPYNYKSAPYQKEWLDVLCDDVTEKVVIIAGARTGKSQVMKNATAYFMANDPSPILWVLPDLGKAGEFSQTEIDPMIRVTPTLKNLVGDKRKRDSQNTKLMKVYAGGILRFRGAATDSGAHGLTIRVLFCDETDRWDMVLEEKGNPVELYEARTISFRHKKKIALTSTPLIKGASHIEQAYLESDQRRYYVPCPHCGEMQHLEWKNLIFTDDTQAPYYACTQGCIIDEGDKFTMLQAGEWKAEYPERKVKGYHINALYSPYVTWQEMADKWKAAKGERGRLQVFINSYLAESWEDASASVTPHGLSTRMETFNAPMPTKTEQMNGAGLIGVGIDVQEQRIELYTYAFGIDDERWPIDFQSFMGEVAVDNTPWNQLTDYLLNARFNTLHGVPVRIACGAIDIGYQPDRVFQWLRDFQKVNSTGIKMYPIHGDTIVESVNHIRFTTHPTYHVPYISLGTSISKANFMTALNNGVVGPQYIHIPKEWPQQDGYPRFVEQEFLEQLTAEALKTKYVKGRPIRIWTKLRARNEAFDCGRYAHAAVLAEGSNYKDSMPALVEKVASARPSSPVQPQTTVTPAPHTPKSQHPVGKGGVKAVNRRPSRFTWSR